MDDGSIRVCVFDVEYLCIFYIMCIGGVGLNVCYRMFLTREVSIVKIRQKKKYSCSLSFTYNDLRFITMVPAQI